MPQANTIYFWLALPKNLDIVIKVVSRLTSLVINKPPKKVIDTVEQQKKYFSSTLKSDGSLITFSCCLGASEYP